MSTFTNRLNRFQAIRQVINSNSFQLFFCGLSALYWELVLIRWLSTSIRIVAYYSNFVLIAAFFGLGAGALLARYRIRLQCLIFPAISLTVLLGVTLSKFHHANPSSPNEFVWIGAAPGISIAKDTAASTLPVLLILTLVYVSTASVFVIFGQWIGLLFKSQKPLWAYSIDILGSIIGILLFTLFSFLQCSPVVWFEIGFVLLFLILDRKIINYAVAIACCVIVLLVAGPFANKYEWSPYYRINVEPLTMVIDKQLNEPVHFSQPVGYTVTVNNDYHQMLLDLRKRPKEHAFLTSWRKLYDAPYRDVEKLPDGPILIVGAGTGNDVSAALRNTDRTVYAVEIDPSIARLGQNLHFEFPYNDPRVSLIIDDARSFFHKTDQKFALIVFGFLDSHTLLSSFSSVRLDNFVYTSESFKQVKQILLPGGKIQLTFASNRKWIHKRFIKLLDEVFDYPTQFTLGSTEGYTNGIIYANGKSVLTTPDAARIMDKQFRTSIPTDNWPFLYLKTPSIPKHYLIFIGLALTLGFISFLRLLPYGERRIRFPYFFLGAAFFLIETSNVINLSLLYGSTWHVNVLVFTGILILILFGNLTSYLTKSPRINLYFGLLTLNIGLAVIVPTHLLLNINSSFLQAIVAIMVFLGPVYFASLLFATLIKNEDKLYQAYGSNMLGAVVGGVCEYLSLMFGFKFLLLLTLAFYLAAYVQIKKKTQE